MTTNDTDETLGSGGYLLADDNGGAHFRTLEEALATFIQANDRRRRVINDSTGEQVWPSTEVEALRKQVADLTAEINRLKDQRRERIATAALQGVARRRDYTGIEWLAADTALRYADTLIAKLDGGA